MGNGHAAQGVETRILVGLPLFPAQGARRAAFTAATAL